MRNCIAVDWLQCHVQVPIRDFENIFDGKLHIQHVTETQLKDLDNRYMLERTGFQTRNFKAIFEIKDRQTGEEIAVLAAEPRSEMCMKQNSGLIKIINKQLYQKNLLAFVKGLLKDLQLVFINITRLDIAADFLAFDTMPCQEFIDMFASRVFIKTQQAKMKMMGDSWSVDRGKLTGGISSLKFGLETSDVNYYLYNKSLELEQVKNKPWIKEHWASNGWDGKARVWRLEFSLHADSRGIVMVDEHGEIHVHSFKDLSLLDSITEVFSHLYNKYFQFVYTEKTKKGNYKKQSRCEKVILFKEMNLKGVSISLSDKKDSGRSAKVFAKKLMEFNAEMRGRDFDMAIMGNDAFTWVINRYDLHEWKEKKYPHIELSERVTDIVNRGRLSRLQAEVHARSEEPRDPRVRMSPAQQAALLQQQADDRRASKFKIIPDGKVPNYNNQGQCIGYVDCPF